MQVGLYLLSAFLLISATLVVFRILVRHDYQKKGRLSGFSSLLELAVWALYMGFPYLYNPPEWIYFWSDKVPVGTVARIIGVGCTCLGFIIAFGTMSWFGMRRAFGLEVSRLIRSGPYSVSRNPQIMGGALLVIGTAVLWPSWYAAGWVVLYGVVAHTMVVTEEEHLRRVFAREYEVYSDKVRRYLGVRKAGKIP